MKVEELQKLVKGWVAEAVEGFVPPPEEKEEDFIRRVADEIFKQIPHAEQVNPKDVKPGDDVPQRSETPMLDTVRLVKASRGDWDVATNKRILDELREKDFVVGTTTAGGHTAPSHYSEELIDLVYKDSNVAGYLRRVPMPRGPAVVIPTVTTGTTAYTVAESSDSGSSTATTESTATYSTVTLTAYRHGVYSKVSNELLEDATPDVEDWIKMDMARQLASYFDWEVFHGTGGAGADGTASLVTGLGVGSDLITTNVFSAGGGLSFDNIVDLMTPEDNTPGDLVMFANPAARRELLKLKDGAGQYVYDPKNGGDMGSIWGIPLVKNNRISKTLGAGSETAIFSGAFSTSGLMGVKSGINLIVDPFTHGEYFATRIVAHIRLGFQVASEDHFAVLNGITV